MCPLTCKTVQEAIRRHDESGIVMQEYVDYHKKFNARCQLCTRNEYAANSPLKHLQMDLGVFREASDN